MKTITRNRLDEIVQSLERPLGAPVISGSETLAIARDLQSLRNASNDLLQQWKEWSDSEHSQADKAFSTDYGTGHRMAAEAIEQCAVELRALFAEAVSQYSAGRG